MIGKPTVTVSGDRTADAWGAPINPNPYFTNNAALWSIGAGGVWTGGLVDCVSLRTVPTNQIPFVSDAGASYRARIRYYVKAVGPSRPPPQTPAQRFGWGIGFWDAAGVHLQPDLLKWREYAAPSGWIEETMDWTGPVRSGAAWITLAAQWSADTSGLSRVVVDSFELFRWDPAQAPDDLSCLADSVTIHHGREEPSGQPEASTATLDLSWDADHDAGPPASLEIGATVRVLVDSPVDPDPGQDREKFYRFVGRVTDIAYGWDDAGQATPDSPVAQVVCAGFSADLGRRVVGDAPFPQELDGARVSRVLGLAGVLLDPFSSDPGTVQILPRDVDSQPALEVAQGTADSASGLVWASRDGYVRYADAEHRRNTTAALDLDACDVLVTPTWSRTLEGLVTSVSIGYGPTPDEGEQARYLADRPDSEATYGTYEYTAATELATQPDAANLGGLLLARNGQPAWVMAELPVGVHDLDAARTADLLGLEMHDLVHLTGLPRVGSAPTSAHLFVEGWTERLEHAVHEVALFVSAYCRTAPPPRWDDMPSATTWDNVGALTWNDAACLGPPVGGDQWADVPANLRWNAVDPLTTWDTWKGI